VKQNIFLSEFRISGVVTIRLTDKSQEHDRFMFIFKLTSDVVCLHCGNVVRGDVCVCFPGVTTLLFVFFTAQ